MEAKVEVRGEVLIVKLGGRLDPETSEPFRRTCWERLVGEKVVFDLKQLNFVGSLGLQSFVDTLDHMAQKSGAGIKFSGVSSEFRRLFEASGLAGTEFFEDPEVAAKSFRTGSL